MLPIDILKLSAEHRWLSETKDFDQGTPSNRIIFKVLPNIGATHGEILLYSMRNSICMQPNVPVLLGKKNARDENGDLMYPNILVVYKDVKIESVVTYLNSDIMPKKILCTPEAYETKVKPAILGSSLDLYKDFFMLLDECDRLIKDVDYRAKIVLPIEDFFKFKQKAMISATAIEPSDPRFAEEGFRILKIVPQFDYAVPINLVVTNNVAASLSAIIKKYLEDHYFIFVNSTNLIHSLIKLLNIEDHSRVFCAPKSVTKLNHEGFKNASSKLEDFKKFNFLTSRYFSAVDIKLKDKKPNVIILTDLYQAEFTMLDPYTDSVQIVGRLRNGIGNIYHISNFKTDLTTFDDEKLRQDLLDSFNEYKGIKTRGETAISDGAKKTNQEALNGTDISLMVDDQGKFNWFMLDNKVLENKVRKYYISKIAFEEAYRLVKNFTPNCKVLWFNVNDGHLHRLKMKENARKRCETVAEILNIYDNPISETGVTTFYIGEDSSTLRKEYPKIAKFYDSIGYANMKLFEFRAGKMRKYMMSRNKNDKIGNPKLKAEIQALYNLAGGDLKINEKKIIADGQAIFTKYGVKKKFSGNDIDRFYDTKRTSDKQNVKWRRLTGLNSKSKN